MVTKDVFDLRELVLALSNTMDLVSPELMKHQQRTAYIATKIAEAGEVHYLDQERLFLAAILHDVGALTSTEKIDLHEFATTELRGHCRLGYRIYNQVKWLQASARLSFNIIPNGQHMIVHLVKKIVFVHKFYIWQIC